MLPKWLSRLQPNLELSSQVNQLPFKLLQALLAVVQAPPGLYSLPQKCGMKLYLQKVIHITGMLRQMVFQSFYLKFPAFPAGNPVGLPAAI